MTRLQQRLATDGVAFVARYAGQKFGKPLERLVFGKRTKSFQVAAPAPVCVPCLSAEDVPFVQSQIQHLQESQFGPGDLRIVVPHLRKVEPLQTQAGSLSVEYVAVDDALELVSLIAWNRYVVLAPRSDTDIHAKVMAIFSRLNVAPYSDAPEFLSAFATSRPPVIRGEARLTYPMVDQIEQRLTDGQYGYTEPLDWDIVKALPSKFDNVPTVRYFPISTFATAYGRLGRQRSVGRIYRDRLQGESVLDVGCDLCGVKEAVSPDTKYVGVDVQGLADHYIDLDKEPLPFSPNSFESVLAFEVLEHLQDIHGQMDKMMSIAQRYFIGSLYIESAYSRGRSTNYFGDPFGNAHLPLAPVFDRHQWIFTFGDALDFVFYRAARAGFSVSELTLFYDDLMWDRARQVQRAFQRHDLKYLGRHTALLAFVLERKAGKATS